MFIDINCDIGESFGNYAIGQDDLIMPYLTSCNIACGFHGGDPYHIEKTINNAIAHNLNIGAHPGYPDLVGFGRRFMDIKSDELSSIIKYQIGAIQGMVSANNGILSYVKPHGALYNRIANHREDAIVVIAAIQAMSPNLKLMGLSGSAIEQVAAGLGIEFIAEAFADRVYVESTKLLSRKIEGAVIEDTLKSAQQVIDIIVNNEIQSYTGKTLTIKAKSICIHGDNPSAIEILKTIDLRLKREGILKKPFC